jgi:hypothetical protein
VGVETVLSNLVLAARRVLPVKEKIKIEKVESTSCFKGNCFTSSNLKQIIEKQRLY